MIIVVIKCGTTEGFYGLLSLYGFENIKIIMQTPWGSDEDMNFVVKIFNIKKKNCYVNTRK